MVRVIFLFAKRVAVDQPSGCLVKKKNHKFRYFSMGFHRCRQQ
jgi:hypothetical protein